jgi:cyclase
MLNKRIIAVVTIHEGWVVQSFGYNRLLPIGRPEAIVKNLDRWSADEIVIQFIDRSMKNMGPDFQTLDSIANLGLSTPLIYVGGISNKKEALEVITRGADRIGIDAMITDSPSQIRDISEQIGSEALIACLPLSVHNGAISWLNYRKKTFRVFDKKARESLNRDNFSELFLIDWQNEGNRNSFDMRLVREFPNLGMGIIAFGGISESSQIRDLLSQKEIVGVAIGNSLNYRESSINALKRELADCPLRIAVELDGALVK